MYKKLEQSDRWTPKYTKWESYWGKKDENYKSFVAVEGWFIVADSF